MSLSLPLRSNSYSSPLRKPSILASALPTAVFYRKFVQIIIKYGMEASRGSYTGERWAQSSLEILHALEESGVQFHIDGLEHIHQEQQACVFVGNHMSVLETMILPCLIQPLKETTFIVKKSLLDYPFFGAVLKSRDPIALGRQNPREDLKLVLDEGTKLLEQGRSIIVFPQSTRGVEFDPKAFNSIGIKLAKKAKVKIIPLAIKSDAWGIGTIIKDFGKIKPSIPVHIRFFEALEVAGAGKDEHQLIIDHIQAALQSWTSPKK